MVEEGLGERWNEQKEGLERIARLEDVRKLEGR
jgi:hypothetical protein